MRLLCTGAMRANGAEVSAKAGASARRCSTLPWVRLYWYSPESLVTLRGSKRFRAFVVDARNDGLNLRRSPAQAGLFAKSGNIKTLQMQETRLLLGCCGQRSSTDRTHSFSDAQGCPPPGVNARMSVHVSTEATSNEFCRSHTAAARPSRPDNDTAPFAHVGAGARPNGPGAMPNFRRYRRARQARSVSPGTGGTSGGTPRKDQEIRVRMSNSNFSGEGGTRPQVARSVAHVLKTRGLFWLSGRIRTYNLRLTEGQLHENKGI
jgi:hypothetical protein